MGDFRLGLKRLQAGRELQKLSADVGHVLEIWGDKYEWPRRSLASGLLLSSDCQDGQHLMANYLCASTRTVGKDEKTSTVLPRGHFGHELCGSDGNCPLLGTARAPRRTVD
jgi:hypothetical protein